ncbi:MAG: hypothetical protein ACOX1P_05560 [Thermoguttaceae bacterium]
MTLAASDPPDEVYADIVPPYEYATDVTTTGQELPYVGGTASDSAVEAEHRFAGFAIRNPAVHLQKMIWCIAVRAQNELVHLPDFEIADAAIASLEESTATETASAEFAKQTRIFFETLSIKCEAFPGPDLARAPEPVQARTPLGRRLREIRQRIEASGAPLLDWNDIERELAERRGKRNSE